MVRCIFKYCLFEKIHTLTPYNGVKAGLFVVASIIIVVATYNFIFQLFNWKWTAKPLAIALVFIGGFAAYAVNTLGVLITSDQIQNLMQTDMRKRVIPGHGIGDMDFGNDSTAIIVILMMKIKPEPIIRQLLHKLIALVVSLAMVLGLLFVFYVDFASIFRTNRDLKGMISPQNMIASFASYYKKKAPKENYHCRVW